jgi:uncharacterized protein (TIGR02246 family)
MTNRLTVLTLASSLVLAAASAAPRPAPDLREALDASESRIRDALRSGDAEAVAAFYTDDAEMLGTSGNVVRGRAAIVRHMGEVMSLGVRDFVVEDQEIFEGDAFAVETGRATFTNGAGTRLAVVRYMTLWKETRDGWMIHRDLSAPVSVGTVPGAAPAAPAAFHVGESEPLHAVVLPMTGPYSRSGEGLARLIVELAIQRIEPQGPAFGRYYDDEDEIPPTDLRFEVGFPVAKGTTAAPPLEVRAIDDGTIVWAVVGGPHDAADRPWAQLEEWVRSRGYAEAGPAMETWLDGPRTEMRMPIRTVE